MIPPDLVRARRRGGRLELVALKGPSLVEAERLASDIRDLLLAAVGKSEEDVQQELLEVPRAPSAEKLFAGLAKLLWDDCEFEAPLETDAVELRRLVFERAALQRKQGTADAFERSKVLADIAGELSLDVDTLQRALFSDLKGAQLLARGPTMSAADVLGRYELAQVQGVLLRAVRIGLDVVCTSPDAYRAFFRKLKFRRLLYRIEPREGGGYHIEVDGPFSLFESVTKYGLALAQLVPALRQCQKVQLSAELRWGAKREPLEFQIALGGQSGDEPTVPRDEVQALILAINRPGTGWSARPSSELLDIPGVGIVVPDLVLEDSEGRLVHVEVMGYWSREAVFRRLDWIGAQRRLLEAAPSPGGGGLGLAGTGARLLLAVSSQLRVSPDVVPPDADGGIYVYKGTMVARALLERARALCQGSG